MAGRKRHVRGRKGNQKKKQKTKRRLWLLFALSVLFLGCILYDCQRKGLLQKEWNKITQPGSTEKPVSTTSGDEQMSRVAAALNALKSPEVMAEKYGMVGAAPLLFAVGDGNHSLATAKACYEKLKKETPEAQWASLPARYALVEVVNLHDDALTFEPIHRVLFHVDGQDLWAAFRAFYPAAHTGVGTGHIVEVCGQGLDGAWTVPAPSAQLAVGTLQAFLDDYCKRRPEVEIDYIHGDDVARKLGSQPGNLGFLLPPMGKDQLFRTVMTDGVLPRKTFSMGEAQDKPYYLEARKIR